MNERIRELSEHCWDNRLDGKHFDQEMFAELIVRECLNNMQNCEGDLGFAIFKTKNHFGVEQ